MGRFVSKVAVIGGGSAGWLTALHLKTVLGPAGEVTVIESPNVPTIGVGEGTQPMLRRQFMTLGIDEDDVMRTCGATFKNGIRFVGWGHAPDSREYLHPFFSGDPSEQGSPLHPMHIWHAARQRGLTGATLANACWVESRLIARRKAPVAFHGDSRQLAPVSNYAYHIDAARLGLYLRDVAISRGVRHISADVIGVTRDALGIAAVQTEEHGEHAAELFIDCTGFARVLMRELTDGDEFEDYGQYLLNDRAIAARIPYEGGNPRGIEACTVSTALLHGWVWEVPLYERLGAGYVYSSTFATDEDAEREFREFVRRKYGSIDVETRVVPFRTGCLRRAWIGNCVSIGLSSGFIEPLEATGIALITYAIERLIELWPTADCPGAPARRFNSTMTDSLEWVRDFIVMHFCLSDRDDSDYWRAVRQPEHVPEGVRSQLASRDTRWPFGEYLRTGPGYALTDESVACILAGFGRYPAQCNVVVGSLSDEALLAQLQRRRLVIEATDKMCIDHATYLTMLVDGRLGERSDRAPAPS